MRKWNDDMVCLFACLLELIIYSLGVCISFYDHSTSHIPPISKSGRHYQNSL